MTTMVMTDNTPNVFGDRWRHTSRDRAPGVEVHYVCEKTRRRPSVRPAVKRPRSSGGSGMAVRGAMTLDWGSSCVLGRRPSSLHVVVTTTKSWPLRSAVLWSYDLTALEQHYRYYRPPTAGQRRSAAALPAAAGSRSSSSAFLLQWKLQFPCTALFWYACTWRQYITDKMPV